MSMMGYMSTWPNAKIIGKKSIYKDDSKSMELPELKVEDAIEEGVVTSKSMEEAPEGKSSSEEQSKAGSSILTERNPLENDQTQLDNKNSDVC